MSPNGIKGCPPNVLKSVKKVTGEYVTGVVTRGSYGDKSRGVLEAVLQEISWKFQQVFDKSHKTDKYQLLTELVKSPFK